MGLSGFGLREVIGSTRHGVAAHLATPYPRGGPTELHARARRALPGLLKRPEDPGIPFPEGTAILLPEPLETLIRFRHYFTASRINFRIPFPTLIDVSTASRTWAGLMVLASPF